MIDFIRAIFKPMPVPGEIYEFDEGRDPFAKNGHTVEVLETKKGWVKYRLVGWEPHTYERLRRSHFHFGYKLKR